jgi:phosphate-selective porin OprO and OprP
MKRCCLFFLIFTASFATYSQNFSTPYFSYGKGLGITSPDSLFMLNIRFRMQNRLALTTESETDLDIAEVEARVRRLRLRFDGFIYTPRLTYVIQLAFTRADMDFDDTGFPNVVRDAMIIYSVTDHFSVGIGQTKLPGNRQRVNSSGDLQFADRSIVNSTFNVDRDFGIQTYYNNNLQGLHYVLRAAVSSGDGRNIISSDRGLAYTGRIELLPLGEFTNGGDYFEGDLAREPEPKIAMGFSYSSNQNAIRTGGQLGKYLFQSRDIYTGMIDFLFKHAGWSFAAEYLKRNSANPLTMNNQGDIRYVYAGHGFNSQGGFLFKSNFEVAARFSQVHPDRSIQLYEPRTRQYTLGGSKYIRGHRLKLQTDLTFEENKWLQGAEANYNNWQWRFQIEAGI